MRKTFSPGHLGEVEGGLVLHRATLQAGIVYQQYLALSAQPYRFSSFASMVEVVQDFLHYVQSGFDLNRQDTLSFYADLDRSECCLLSEDTSDPVGARRVMRMKDLLFSEVLDVPFDQKSYDLQLQEFSLRCQRVVPQIDMQLLEAQKMLRQQPHCQSKHFAELLMNVADGLHKALLLMREELTEVWHLRWEASFFYPNARFVQGPNGEPPLATEEEVLWPGGGGFLDLSDMFLTSKLLVRHLTDVVSIVTSAVLCLPKASLDKRGLQAGRMDPRMRQFLRSFFARSPRLRATVPGEVVAPRWKLERGVGGRGRSRSPGLGVRSSGDEGTHGEGGDGNPSYSLSPRQRGGTQHNSDNAPASAGESGAPGASSSFGGDKAAGNAALSDRRSRLGEAMGALDEVLIFRLNELASDMHRQMYHAFVRMCQMYVRWKRLFEHERTGLLEQKRRSIVGNVGPMEEGGETQEQGEEGHAAGGTTRADQHRRQSGASRKSRDEAGGAVRSSRRSKRGSGISKDTAARSSFSKKLEEPEADAAPGGASCAAEKPEEDAGSRQVPTFSLKVSSGDADVVQQDQAQAASSSISRGSAANRAGASGQGLPVGSGAEAVGRKRSSRSLALGAEGQGQVKLPATRFQSLPMPDPSPDPSRCVSRESMYDVVEGIQAPSPDPGHHSEVGDVPRRSSTGVPTPESESGGLGSRAGDGAAPGVPQSKRALSRGFSSNV